MTLSRSAARTTVNNRNDFGQAGQVAMRHLPISGQTRITVPGPARLGHPVGYVIDGKSYQFFPVQAPHYEPVRVYRTKAA